MKFSLDDYKGNYVMHCRTKEENDIFLGFLADNGRQWCNGRLYTETILSGATNRDTCYAFNIGQWCDYEWYVRNLYTVLEFSEFEWDGMCEVTADSTQVDSMLEGL